MKNYQFTQFMKYSRMKGAIRGDSRVEGGSGEAKSGLKPVTSQMNDRKIRECMIRTLKLNYR